MTNEPSSIAELTLPTPERPLILVYSGKIPAMKNQTRVNIKEVIVETASGVESRSAIAGVGKPAKVRRWLKSGESLAEAQMQSQGFHKIPFPFRVATWTILGFYKSPTTKSPKLFIPKNDADNAFTTIQETWKDTIMDDDRQVVDYHVSTRHFNNEQSMFTVSFVWTLPLELHDYTQAVSTFMNQFPLLGGKPVWEIMKQIKNGS